VPFIRVRKHPQKAWRKLDVQPEELLSIKMFEVLHFFGSAFRRSREWWVEHLAFFGSAFRRSCEKWVEHLAFFWSCLHGHRLAHFFGGLILFTSIRLSD